jgi:hypothetical protein
MASMTGQAKIGPQGDPLDTARGITLGAMMSSALWIGLAITLWPLW